jgi:two-component system response regulator HydG
VRTANHWQRPEDIVWLLDRLLENASTRSDASIRGFSALTEEAALAHPWPGNVRELRSRVDRALALTASEWIMPGISSPTVRDADDAGFPTSVGLSGCCGMSANRRALNRLMDQGQRSRNEKALCGSHASQRTQMCHSLNPARL